MKGALQENGLLLIKRKKENGLLASTYNSHKQKKFNTIL